MHRLLILLFFIVVIAPAAKAQIPIGFNLAPIKYYSPTPVFVDLMKTTGDWLWYSGTNWGSSETAASYDDNGYPTVVPQTIDGESKQAKILFNANATGDYVILYEGDGQLTAHNPGGGSLSTSSAANKIYIRLTPTTLNNSNFAYIKILSSKADNPVRNIRIIPVDYENNEADMPTFLPQYTKGLEPFAAIRFMDFTRTNSSPNTFWEKRTTPSSHGQGTERGIAWEYAIELCNSFDKDIWINVPHRASDNYIIELATLLKNQLEPERTIYLEYSNEVWNAIFEVTNWLKNNAVDHVESYVTRDLREINNTYGKSDWASCEVAQAPWGQSQCDWRLEKFAYMFARTFRLFGSVFGEEMEHRVVRVAATKLNSAWHSEQILKYLFETDGVGADALSPTGYFGLNNADRLTLDAKEAQTPGSVTISNVLDAAWSHIVAENGYTNSQKIVADSYGVYMVVYEGGQHMDWRGDSTDSDGNKNKNDDPEDGWAQELYDAQIHPEMYNLYLNRLQNQEKNGVKLFMAFDYVSERESIHGSWGHLESLDQLDLSPAELATAAPKYQALLDFNGEAPENTLEILKITEK